jgi:hypothetical protein
MEPIGSNTTIGRAGAGFFGLILLGLALAPATAQETKNDPSTRATLSKLQAEHNTNKFPRIVTGTPEFTPQVIATGIDLAHSVRAADFDGDGDIDAVSADCGPPGPFCAPGGGGVFWFENDGAGNFTTRTIDNALNGAYPVDVADVDQDSDWDVLAAGYIADQVAWYKNNGAGGFLKQVIDATADGPHSIVSGDVDSDGDYDLLAANQDGNQVVWYENQGHEVFGPAIVVDSGARGAKRAELGDMDGDGDQDIVAVSFFDNTVAWFENDGAQSFSKRVIDLGTRGAYSVLAIDIDSDSDLDVLTASQLNNTIAVFRNNGSGSFSKQVIDATALGARTVRAADIDGDGMMDVLAASVDDNTIAWYRNDGDGEFVQYPIDTGAPGAYGVWGFDMDRDGDIDVLGAHRDSGQVLIYSNSRAHQAVVSSGGMLTFDSVLLRTSDPDDSPSGLTYKLKSLPVRGQLRLGGTSLSLNDTFTQADINSGSVGYQHNGSPAPATDNFEFEVADGGEGGVMPLTGSFAVNVVPISPPETVD